MLNDASRWNHSESTAAEPRSLLPWGLLSLVLTGPLFIPCPGFDVVVWCAMLAGLYAYQDERRPGDPHRLNTATIARFRPLLPLCLLAVWSLLSVGWSDGVDGVFEFITLLANWCAVFTFIAVTACLARFRTTMGTCLVVLAMVVSLVALFSLVWQYLVLDRSLAYRGFRIAGSGLGDFANLRNPIDAGLFYGVFATVLVFYLCRQGRAAFRWLCLVALVPLLVYLLLTYSRGAMFSFVAATVVIAALSGQRTGRWCAILLALLAACMALFGETLLQAELDKGFNGREPIWQHALELVRQAPLMGHGAGQVFDYLIPRTGTIYHFAHNYLLTLWNHYGLVGVLLFLWLIAEVTLRCLKRREDSFYILVLGLLAFGFVGIQSYVDELVRQSHQYWLLIWLPVGMVLQPLGRE